MSENERFSLYEMNSLIYAKPLAIIVKHSHKPIATMKKTHTASDMTTKDVQIIRDTLHSLKFPPKSVSHAKKELAQLRSYRANLVNYNLLTAYPEYVSQELSRLCVIISNRMAKLNDWIRSQKNKS